MKLLFCKALQVVIKTNCYKRNSEMRTYAPIRSFYYLKMFMIYKEQYLKYMYINQVHCVKFLRLFVFQWENRSLNGETYKSVIQKVSISKSYSHAHPGVNICNLSTKPHPGFRTSLIPVITILCTNSAASDNNTNWEMFTYCNNSGIFPHFCIKSKVVPVLK